MSRSQAAGAGSSAFSPALTAASARRSAAAARRRDEARGGER